MKRFLLITALQLTYIFSFGQTGLTEDFNDNSLAAGWGSGGNYTLTETNQELRVAANVTSNSYSAFSFNFSALNLTEHPFLKVKIKSAAALNVRIDLIDNMGNTTNFSPLVRAIPGNGAYSTYTLNFNGLFSQSWPGPAVVNAANITQVVFFFNPGGSAFSGNVYFDDLLLGSATGLALPPSAIRLNQIGFYPYAPKTAIAVNAPAGLFYITSSDKQDTVYTGTLGSAATWTPSGESVRKADFTSFTTPGIYYVLVPTLGYSHLFNIQSAVHNAVAKATLKAFYFQRASTALTAPYAGIWARAAGHPDNNVYVHNSAATLLRPENTIISSPRGWYDAGDYNKYIVNSGISTYTVLAMYENFSTYFDTLNTNIPESGNAIPDVLDEALWNLRWMLTMQDPSDGGVYHKLTNSNFGGTIMPSAATSARYVVKKSTGAALNFAAVMAQAARVFSNFDTELPGLSDSCINASVNAWNWARKNPNVQYIQSELSSPTISTGTYDDTNFSDEFSWAGYELYATTRLDSFYTAAGSIGTIFLPSWRSVRALGHYTLTHLRKQLTPIADTLTLKNSVIAQANQYRDETQSSEYGVGMTNGSFYWGSNSVAANQGIVMIRAFNISKDSVFLKAALANLDYILGRNATNYSFVTGYGDNLPGNIHHRISGADGIDEPIPGLLAGGPNTDALSDCGSTSYPSSTYKAKAYLDSYCSYSTNEIAINWNAPMAFLSGAIEAVEAGISSNTIITSPVLPTKILAVNKPYSAAQLKVYPNPSSKMVNVEFECYGSYKIILSDITGRVVMNESGIQNGKTERSVNIEALEKGIYSLTVISDNAVSVSKLIVDHDYHD